MGWRTPKEEEQYRRRYLPQQLDNARRKVKALENEARRYGMLELLKDISNDSQG